MITRNSLALEAQVEERPLAKLQEELQEAVNGELASETPASHSASSERENTSKPPETPGEKHHRKALLKNDDTELQRVKGVSGGFPCDMQISESLPSFWTLCINNSSKPMRADLSLRVQNPRFQAEHSLRRLCSMTFG